VAEKWDCITKAEWVALNGGPPKETPRQWWDVPEAPSEPKEPPPRRTAQESSFRTPGEATKQPRRLIWRPSERAKLKAES
jgi:hypothetical protein